MPFLVTRRSAGILLAAIVLAASSPTRADGDGHFTITDELAPDEVSENTDVYVDGMILAHIHLDAKTPADEVAGHAPDPAGPHDYALCGDITVRRKTGGTETHEVNASGRLSDIDDRHFQALGAADFTFFYLADPAPGREPTQPSRNRSPFCHPPVS